MDLETLAKRLEWLDEEHRKDKDQIARLQQQLETALKELEEARSRTEKLETDVSRLSGMLNRIDQLAGEIDVFRKELQRQLNSLSRETEERLAALEETRKGEVDRLHQLLTDLRREVGKLARLKGVTQAQAEEDARLARLIASLEQRFDEVQRNTEEMRRARKLMEEERAQDLRRLTDLSGQITALRKRLEETRSKGELTADTLARVEQRLKELVLLESERRETQAAFMERHALQEAERQRTWNLWEQRFETIEQQSRDLEARLQSLSLLERDVRQSQQALDQATERFERRVNEITEMQRLMEDRMHQEWVNFKAEDQKRWANYMLTQDEQRNEAARQMEKLRDQVVRLEETLEEIRDFLQQIDAQTSQQLQSLLALVREWVTAYERMSGALR